jgi:molybdopterin molybdotransferase
MISVEEAIEIILNEITANGPENIGILDSYGRVLAEDIYAPWDLPPWDNSAMDGFAVRADDLSGKSGDGNRKKLNVIEDLPAGYMAKKEVRTGEAIRIMTGAPLPKGSDSVVMVEHTEGTGSDVTILEEIRKGQNVRPKGEDIKEGALILEKGLTIRPAEVGMLSAMGKANLLVYRKPKVAVMSTGDELVEVDNITTDGTVQSLPKGKIVDSNSYTVFSQVLSAGALPIRLGIAKDTKEALKTKIEEAMSADVIISTGGVSVGDYDFVKDVLHEIGAVMKFWKVAIKPGKPLAFGMIQKKPYFGLPGNPVSSMVAFEEFVRPALLKMMGRSDIFRITVEAELTEEIRKKPGRTNFIQSGLKEDNGDLLVSPIKIRGSAVMSSMVRANSLVILPKESSGADAGETVKVQPLDAEGQEKSGF